jgi:hypothetical protein
VQLSLRLLLVLSSSLALLSGCGSSNDSAERESSNLKPLAVFYGRYIGSNRGKSPADENELKEFIRSQPADELNNLGVTDVEALFISSRDKKPYKFNFKAKASNPGEIAVFAWEQDGVEGKRFVGGTLGQIEEVDSERFQKLVPNP